MKQPFYEVTAVPCACAWHQHTVIMSFHEGSAEENDDPLLFMEAISPPQPSFWKRVVFAFRVLLGMPVEHGYSIVYDAQTARAHLYVLNRFIWAWDNHYNKAG